MEKLGLLSLEPGAYLLRALNQARAFEPEPRLIPPLQGLVQLVKRLITLHTIIVGKCIKL